MISVNDNCSIGDNEISLSFVRSPGPGGQNVNKVSTAVLLRFDIAGSPSLSSDVKQRLIAIAGNKVTEKGELLIHASTHRTQEQNRTDAIKRLTQLIARALQKPKKRKKTRPSHSSKKLRLHHKRQHGEKKKNRRINVGEFD